LKIEIEKKTFLFSPAPEVVGVVIAVEITTITTSTAAAVALIYMAQQRPISFFFCLIMMKIPHSSGRIIYFFLFQIHWVGLCRKGLTKTKSTKKRRVCINYNT